MNCLMSAWHRHEAKLRAWLRGRLGNPHDAEDMLVHKTDEPVAVDRLAACLPRALAELSMEDRDPITLCDMAFNGVSDEQVDLVSPAARRLLPDNPAVDYFCSFIGA
jgi:hypothetical protein